MKEAPSKDTLHKNKQMALLLEIRTVVALGVMERLVTRRGHEVPFGCW